MYGHMRELSLFTTSLHFAVICENETSFQEGEPLKFGACHILFKPTISSTHLASLLWILAELYAIEEDVDNFNNNHHNHNQNCIENQSPFFSLQAPQQPPPMAITCAMRERVDELNNNHQNHNQNHVENQGPSPSLQAPRKTPRINWKKNPKLQQKFLDAVDKVGGLERMHAFPYYHLFIIYNI